MVPAYYVPHGSRALSFAVFEMVAKTRMLAQQRRSSNRLPLLHAVSHTLCRTLGRTLCRTAPVCYNHPTHPDAPRKAETLH